VATFTVNARCVDGYAAADVVVTALRDIPDGLVIVRIAEPQDDETYWQHMDSVRLAAGESQYVLVPLPDPNTAAISVVSLDPASGRVELPPVIVPAPSCPGSPTAPVVTAEVARPAGDDAGAIAVTITDPPGGTERNPWVRVEWKNAPPDSTSVFVSYMHEASQRPEDGEQVTMIFDNMGFTECCGEEIPGEDNIPDPLGPGDYSITLFWAVTLTGSDESGRVDSVVEQLVEGDTIELTLQTVESTPFRVASFDVSLSRAADGDLVSDLSTPDDQRASVVAEILQRTRPDIVLLGGFDLDAENEAVELFLSNYLSVSQGGADPIDYPYWFTAPVNTGVPSGFDLDNDGVVGDPDDAFGPGAFAGQRAMVLLSRYPILTDEIRTFQKLPWAAMPDARLPDDPTTAEPADWFSSDELAVVRLASTSLWDVPVDIDGRVVHLLSSAPATAEPQPGVDLNWLRTADEIRFWAEYIAGADSSWIVDDAGLPGGLVADSDFVIVGDLNCDPVDGDTADGAMELLLGLDSVNDTQPASEGGQTAAIAQGGANETQRGDPATDTADLVDDPAPGNLRTDYALPSVDLEVVDAGVFWPPANDSLSALVSDPATSSNHRLVWVDLS
jgi:Endonuclease/Exonuclease/phosphatase family